MQMFVLRRTLAACLALIAPSSAWAQFHDVIPPANEAVDGISNNLIPLGISDGVFQVIYAADQLVGLPIGASIQSLQLRQSNSATAPWPPANATITDYEIRLGTSTLTPATRSATFANNITNAVLVRDGALTFAAGAFPGGPSTGTTPEGWGPVLTFTTPYVYRGGPLVIEIRTSGGAPAGTQANCVDSDSSAGSVSITFSQTATVGVISNSPAVIRLGYTPGSAIKQTLPPANDTVAGPNANSIPIGHFTNGRHVNLYNADQLAAIPPGSLIVGLQLRQSNLATAAWPPANATVNDYELWLAQSNRTPSTISSTFSDNLLNPEQVHDGSLALTANIYPGGANAGATPEGWGPVIAFDTPYVYRGGVLALDIRSTGGVVPQTFAECVNNAAPAAGVTGALAGASGAAAGAVVVRFQFIPPLASPFGEGVTKIYALKQFADTPAGITQAAWTFSSSISNQAVFNAAQFQTVGPGTELTGLSFRNASTTAWPTAPASASSYSLELSRSLNGPSSLSTTVANNIGPDNTTVRSGVLNLPTGIMAAKPSVGTAAFTWEIPFDQPYAYRFGNLLTVGRNTSIGPGVAGSVDAVPSTSPVIGVEAKGFFTVGAPGPVISSNANVPVMRFSADAQVMTPNLLASGTGFVDFLTLNTPLASNPATFQNIIAASELEYIPVGGLITSVEFFNGGISWPSTTAWADEYQVTMSTSKNRPASAGLTFADNEGADSAIVRSGPISWTAGSLPLPSAVLPGARITFDRGFVYAGGDLCITFRHSGVHNGGPTLRNAGNFTTNRAIRSPDQLATSGDYLPSNTGAAMRLGYIPSAVSPKNILNADGINGRFLLDGTRVYQSLYNAEQITVPVGATINGVAFRVDESVAVPFPISDHSLDRFDVTMSTATTSAGTMSATFAANEGPDVVTVRSGPITFPARSFPAHDSQRAFSRFIPFTRPFVYKGGPMVMTIRAGAITTNGGPGQFLDAHSTGAAGVRNTASPDAATGSSGIGALAARFAFTDDAFCPWDLNNDGVVNDDDFQVFVLSYNILDCADPTMPLGCPSDFTFDRIVNDDDFLPFVQAYNDLLCP